MNIIKPDQETEIKLRSDFTARPYQVELAEIGKNQNIIIKLNTGSGKTFIAVLIIKDFLRNAYLPLSQGGKRVFVIVNTVNLVYQQSSFLRKHLPLTNEQVGAYHGQVTPGVWIDDWKLAKWTQELNKRAVVVCTAGVINQAISHDKISLKDISLFIFDECHHASPKAKSDYTELCIKLQLFNKNSVDQTDRVRIIGLTSVISNKNISMDFENHIEQWENLLQSTLVTASESSLESFSKNVHEKIIEVSNAFALFGEGELYNPFYSSLRELIESSKTLSQTVAEVNLDVFFQQEICNDELMVEFLKAPQITGNKISKYIASCVTIFENYGAWCAFKACLSIVKMLQNLIELKASKIADSCSIKRIMNELANSVRIYETIVEKEKQLISPSQNYLSKIARLFPMSQKIATFIRQLLFYKATQECKSFLQEAKDGTYSLHCCSVVHKVQTSSFTEVVEEDAINNKGETFCGLVLVETRLGAQILYELIKDLSSKFPEFSAFQVGFCFSSNSLGHHLNMSQSQQQHMLDSLKESQLNLLISTNVVEEGLDICACNLIIKLDDVSNYRSYIQARGRARADNSNYIIFSKDKHKTEIEVSKYKALDQKVNNYLRNRRFQNMILPEEPECKLDEDFIQKNVYMPFGPCGASITPNIAATILNQIFSNFTSDCSYIPQCLFDFERYDSKVRARMLFPPVVPYRSIVEGIYASNKDSAKQLARLEGCKILHRLGFLTPQLLPVDLKRITQAQKPSCPQERYDIMEKMAKSVREVEQIQIAENILLNDVEESTSTADKQMRIPVCIPEVMRFPYQRDIDTDSHCYLYTWDIVQTEMLCKAMRIGVDVFQNNHLTIGWLFSKPLTKEDCVSRIPLYLANGMYRVFVKLARKISLVPDQLSKCSQAHHILCKLSFGIGASWQYGDSLDGDPMSCMDTFKSMVYKPQSGSVNGLYVIYDSDKKLLDFKAMEDLAAWDASKPLPQSNSKIAPPFQSSVLRQKGCILSQLPPSMWYGRIVKPICHTPNDRGNYVCVDADSMKKSAHKHNFFYDKYGSPHVTPTVPYGEEDTPLAGVMRCTRNISSCNSSTGEKCVFKPENRVVFPAYLLKVHPLPALLWVHLSLTPHVLRQVIRCLLASELKTCLSSQLYDVNYAPDLATTDAHSIPVKMNDRLTCHITGPANAGCKRLKADGNMDITINEALTTKSNMFVHHYEEDKLIMIDLTRPQCPDPARHYICHGSSDHLLVPNAEDLITSTTMSGVNDVNDLESLEWLGDSLLKFAATLRVFSKFPDAGEGILTSERVKLISNGNLIDKAIKLELSKYIIAYDFKISEHYIPPGYWHKPDEVFSCTDERYYSSVSRKALADMMESLIGLFLVHVGAQAAIRLLVFMEVSDVALTKCADARNRMAVSYSDNDQINWVKLLLGNNGNLVANNCVISEKEYSEKMKIINSSKKKYAKEGTQFAVDKLADLQKMLTSRFASIEEVLKYSFKNKFLLATAFSHSSSDLSQILGNYQRLEFLGDSVIDFVISQWIFCENKSHDPGVLSDMRTALVNNKHLAYLMVQNNMYKYVDHKDPTIQMSINRYVNNVKNVKSLHNLVDESKVPCDCKLLGDVFEAIIGAMYIDCNADHAQITKVIQLLFQQSFYEFSSQPPKNLIREMYKKYPDIDIAVSAKGDGFVATTRLKNEDIETSGITSHMAKLTMANKVLMSQ